MLERELEQQNLTQKVIKMNEEYLKGLHGHLGIKDDYDL